MTAVAAWWWHEPDERAEAVAGLAQTGPRQLRQGPAGRGL